jgi:hypothetical protein
LQFNFSLSQSVVCKKIIKDGKAVYVPRMVSCYTIIKDGKTTFAPQSKSHVNVQKDIVMCYEVNGVFVSAEYHK